MKKVVRVFNKFNLVGAILIVIMGIAIIFTINFINGTRDITLMDFSNQKDSDLQKLMAGNTQVETWGINSLGINNFKIQDKKRFIRS